MRVSVSVNSISKLNPNDINKALKRAVDFVALDIVKDAKNYAPSDTGNLRMNIKAMPSKNNNGKIEGRAFVNSEYAAYVEFGTGARGRETNANPNSAIQYTSKDSWKYQDEEGKWHIGRPQEARSFMYKAARNSKKRFPKIVEMALKKGV